MARLHTERARLAGMRYFLFGLSALLCLAAVVAKIFHGGFALPLAPAFIFLVVGMLKSRSEQRPVQFEDLEGWHREELQGLLDNGQFGTAVRQVQMWFRGTSHERAEEIVRRLT